MNNTGMIEMATPFERVTHWGLAISCILLTISGFGFVFKLEAIGAAFGGFTSMKNIHNWLGIAAGVLHELVGALLGEDQHAGDLALGDRARRLLGRGRLRDGRRGGLLFLELGDLRLGGRDLLLGRGQAVLEVLDLLEHRIDLSGKLVEKLVDLLGVVAVLLGLRERLLLDVCRSNSHVMLPFTYELAASVV